MFISIFLVCCHSGDGNGPCIDSSAINVLFEKNVNLIFFQVAVRFCCNEFSAIKVYSETDTILSACF